MDANKLHVRVHGVIPVTSSTPTWESCRTEIRAFAVGGP